MPGSSANVPSQEASENAEREQGFLLAMRGGIANLLKGGRIMLDMQPEAEPTRRNAEMREYSEVIRETDVISIPDVHGDIMALRMSLDSAGLIDARGDWIGGNKVVQFLGDYIDRGEKNLEVLDFLSKLKKQVETAGGRVDLVLGNHESMMLGSIADISGYRDIWVTPDNGGDMIFEEIRQKYQLTTDDEVWERMQKMIGFGGEYHELFDSMKLVSQVDDVLYVHAGINAEWAETIEKKGIDGVNQMWKSAYSDLMRGKDDDFYNITGKHGPLWINYEKKIKKMSESEMEGVAKSLKKRGINAIVVGHSIMEKGPEMHAGFEKHGIKVIASDVGMSAGCGLVSARGGVKIDKEGNIEGRSMRGIHKLHEAEEPAPQSVAA